MRLITIIQSFDSTSEYIYSKFSLLGEYSFNEAVELVH